MNFDELQDEVWDILKDGPDEITVQTAIVHVIRTLRTNLNGQVAHLYYEEGHFDISKRAGFEACREQVLGMLHSAPPKTTSNEMRD
jgi:hypothetical protein